jgi:hypothetical protein
LTSGACWTSGQQQGGMQLAGVSRQLLQMMGRARASSSSSSSSC